jgi:hypothetical protein
MLRLPWCCRLNMHPLFCVYPVAGMNQIMYWIGGNCEYHFDAAHKQCGIFASFNTYTEILTFSIHSFISRIKVKLTEVNASAFAHGTRYYRIKKKKKREAYRDCRGQLHVSPLSSAWTREWNIRLYLTCSRKYEWE